MDAKLLESNTQCHSQKHTEHLCYIISQGFHLSDESEYKALTDNPKFKCEHCGRVANEEKNLCEPAGL